MSRKPVVIDATFEAEARETARNMERGDFRPYGSFNPSEYAAGLPVELPPHIIEMVLRRLLDEVQSRQLPPEDPRVRALRLLRAGLPPVLDETEALGQ